MGKIKIKKSWYDVSIADFMKLKQMKQADYESQLAFNLALLGILTGREPLEIYNSGKYERLLKYTCFLSAKPKGRLSNHYTIGGRKYVCSLELGKATAFQYIDVLPMLSKPDVESIPRLLAVFLSPAGVEYPNVDVNEEAQFIRDNFNIADALAISTYLVTQRKAIFEQIEEWL